MASEFELPQSRIQAHIDKKNAEKEIAAQKDAAQKDAAQKDAAQKDADEEDVLEAPSRFPPEEEASLLGESNDKKLEANILFSSAKYENAINKYEEATIVCPYYLEYELAVLKSNVAACHLKLEQWKDAITSATKAVEGLDRLERAEAAEQENKKKQEDADEEIEEEIVSSGAQNSAPDVKEENESEKAKQKRKHDILRIRAKALMRRARARSELGGWANLSGAEEDYKTLSEMTNLSQADRKMVSSQLRLLPPRAKAAQEKEMGEMWGKLKDLGNGILKPFGLSTDNFQMAKDEKTGGYSMNFKQGE